MKKCDIGVIGLGVMGSNLARNIRSKGYSVAVYDLDPSKTGFLAAEGFEGCSSLSDFSSALSVPRKALLMVPAGKPVDDIIEKLLEVFEKGDIIIDGGNSHFPDTARRCDYLEDKGLLYIGTGVSGGEEGALKGPSMMPGGNPAAWESVRDIFQSICAKTPDGEPCCEWIGSGGAGHFVKMVHNGIEYGDMQLICEAYQLMRDGLGLSNEEMHEVFSKWNQGELSSYLIEITANILAFKDKDGRMPVDYILDRAGQKGTGKWTGIAALDEAVPLTLITEAVFARCISAMKDERVKASGIFPKKTAAFEGDKKEFTEALRKALYASKIVSYAQGYMLMKSASENYGWNLNYGGIALTWRGGCIIRSSFLGKIKEAFDRDPNLENLLLDEYFSSVISELIAPWRQVVGSGIAMGIPMPAFSSALAWFDGYTSEKLPANLLQAQRDYFGAHTYERTDAPRGQFFHTKWTEV